MKTFISVLFVLFTFASGNNGLYAYNIENFENDRDKILTLQNHMVKDSICSYIDMKKSQPVMTMEDAIACSLDVSYGITAIPLFAYQVNSGDYGLFTDFKKIYPSGGESIPVVNASMDLSFPGRITGTLNLSYLPAADIGGAKYDNFKINANIYYHLLYEKFTSIGLFAGGGYSYTSGNIARRLVLSYSDDAGGVSYNGNMNSTWNYNAVNAELFVHKLLFVINFYGRASYYYLFGETSSSLNGNLSIAGDISRTSLDKTDGRGLVLSCGMEIVLGWVKLNVEAGRDWLTSSLSGNLGIRIGM